MEGGFTQKVIDIVRAIPRGETLSYRDVALRAGSPGASRAVGSIMKKNYNLGIPCHRVIRSNGHPGEYNRGGSVAKQALLDQERAFSHRD